MPAAPERGVANESAAARGGPRRRPLGAARPEELDPTSAPATSPGFPPRPRSGATLGAEARPAIPLGAEEVIE